MGYNTVEVYLENRGPRPVSVASVQLNGKQLPAHLIYGLPESLFRIDIGHDEIPIMKSRLPLGGEVIWWQVYPSADIPSGGSAVCQVNLRDLPTFQRELRILDSVGNALEARIPRFRQPEELITAVTWSLDYGRMFVQYESRGRQVKSVEVNRLPVKEFKLLGDHDRAIPDVVAFAPPCELRRGEPVCVELEFEGGRRRYALVRAASGITLDAPMPRGVAEGLLKELGLDADPAIGCLPFDPACSDSRNAQPGNSAMGISNARMQEFGKQPDRLMGVDCCTAIYPEFWNIYGQLADALVVKPYALGWGSRKERFIEEDEDKLRSARLGAAPHPIIWVPQRFSRGGRYLSPEELRLLAWMMLVRGGKGVRYHFWMNSGSDPLAGCEDLLPALKALNHEIIPRRAELSALVPAWEGEQSGVKIYQSWAGDQGLLVMARNLDYIVELEPASESDPGPRLHARVKKNLRLTMPAPEWFRPGAARDFLDNTPARVSRVGNDLNLEIDELELFKLVWIENAG